jgi:uncharacterized protein (TIGR00255 family)
MKSMTGFGRGIGEWKNTSIIVEIKSLNHKFLDLNVKMPTSFQILEMEVRKQIMGSLSRGKVEVLIKEQTLIRSKSVQLNEALLEEYLQLLRQVGKKLNYEDVHISMKDILSINHIWEIIEKERPLEDIRKSTLLALDQAIVALDTMRENEGNHLAGDLMSKTQILLKMLEKLKVQSQTSMHEKLKVFKEKMNLWIPESLADHSRLATEEAVLLQRLDVDEECVRLKSHLTFFGESLQRSGVIGRHLDFLIQEMNREINTIGSKSFDAAIAQLVIQFKEILEQLREQVQNLE